jgi:DNA-binding IclR family transcriptional regulator
VAEWSFLTNHARVLLCIAHDPGVRLRDIAARTGVTERTAYGIVTDLTEAGYIVKHKDGRRNRYQIQAHLPLPETDSRKRTIGAILALLTGAAASLGITERSAFGIITDLVEAGYVVKEKDGRRHRYHTQAHLPLSEPASRERTIGEVLAFLVGIGPATS